MNILQTAISTPIQLFFAWRIRRLTESNWIPIIIAILAFTSLGMYTLPIISFDYIQLDCQTGAGVWTAVKIVVVKLFSLKYLLVSPAMVWFLTSCVADLLITVTLVIYLVRCELFWPDLVHEFGTHLVKASNWFRAIKWCDRKNYPKYALIFVPSYHWIPACSDHSDWPYNVSPLFFWGLLRLRLYHIGLSVLSAT